MKPHDPEELEKVFWSTVNKRVAPIPSSDFEKRVMERIRAKRSTFISWEAFPFLGRKAWQILPLAASVTVFFIFLAMGPQEKYADENLWLDAVFGADAISLGMNIEGGP